MKIVSACLVLLTAIGCATVSRADTTATPVITLATGTYAMPTSTTITDSTAGASIEWCYTGTGTCAPAAAYTGSVYVNPATTETICANATAPGDTLSATTCAYYTAFANLYTGYYGYIAAYPGIIAYSSIFAYFIFQKPLLCNVLINMV